jgi:hypothetical protein
MLFGLLASKVVLGLRQTLILYKLSLPEICGHSNENSPTSYAKVIYSQFGALHGHLWEAIFLPNAPYHPDLGNQRGFLEEETSVLKLK